MNNPFLIPTTGFVKQIQPNKPVQVTEKQSVQTEQKSNRYKYALGGMSLITLCTTAGMLYFSRKSCKSNKIFTPISKGNRTSTPIANYSEYTMSTPVVVYPSGSTTTTPVVPTTTWKTTKTTDMNISRRRHRPTPQPVVQGIIQEVSKELQEYLKTCQDRKINPEKVDEILTKAVGESNVTERPFRTNPLHPRGRVKQYKSPNGRIYVLETHDVLSKNLTRVYMQDKDKHLRAYLFPDGTFRLNSYKSDEAHFITTSKGKRWMEKSKYLNNGAT